MADDVQELDAYKEGVDEGEDGRALDAAAAAAAAVGASATDAYYQQDYEAQQYYDAEGNLVQADYEADPLANWQAGRLGQAMGLGTRWRVSRIGDDKRCALFFLCTHRE